MDVEHTKALTEDVTEGPWEVETIPETGESRVLRRFEFFGEQIEIVAPGGMQREDAMFIAHARTEVPALVAAVERVQALHTPDGWGYCVECHDQHPCPTRQALEIK
ncbi:hypothetical protein [Rhodococcus qingshengii]|uniref:hypothetical protein n=1 Tax=Rhodococcus qingshengii TaxID=334542 RepID=UPI001C8C70E5|nr:hypothetical protein [Rhodococcus qingshengii]MBX9150049.1 hypothetical protein [Rhodococcus qingshengii]